ncbi:hypothetical protein HPB49_009970 [Dermacentor silvarum]|uniref:Uncharacterized protein n=1 Tax=Dermacentor silvarum TaxID=543639 RepID=A0ACB8DCG1_DERSI|nr:hypothetical protein HPB49_009970 [Dermacentor silvarum]
METTAGRRSQRGGRASGALRLPFLAYGKMAAARATRISHCPLVVDSEEYRTVDEMVIPFKGRSSIKQYLLNKSKHWGFKLHKTNKDSLWAAVHAEWLRGTELATDLFASMPMGMESAILAEGDFTKYSLMQNLPADAHRMSVDVLPAMWVYFCGSNYLTTSVLDGGVRSSMPMSPIARVLPTVRQLLQLKVQFLERELTDGTGVITAKFVQKLYAFEMDKTVKLMTNLTRKHVYPLNVEKMNVFRTLQIFSSQVTAALCHLQENRCGDPALYSFIEVSPTILFMKLMKQWFDVHDTVYRESDSKKPISDENDHRMLWLEKDFTCNVRNIQEASIASGKGEFTDETYHALLFATKATVETTRFLLGRRVKCVRTAQVHVGGNNVRDARAVTIALHNIVKGKAVPIKQMQVTYTHAEELAIAVPQEATAELDNLKGDVLNPSLSVTNPGLVYVGVGTS